MQRKSFQDGERCTYLDIWDKLHRNSPPPLVGWLAVQKMADSPGMQESWSPPRARRRTSTTPTIRRVARTTRSNSGTIRICDTSSIESDALKRIEETLNSKLDALHGENTELKARLEHTLSTLAKADHDRKEQLKEIST
jgi:hypothetical protein